MDDIGKIAQIATDWWYEAISKPSLSNYCSCGFTDEQMCLTEKEKLMLYGLNVANEHLASEDQLKAFSQQLCKYITTQFVQRDCYFLCIVTGYGPECYMKEIALNTRIHFSLFPWNTKMCISRKEILIKRGNLKPLKVFP